MTIANYIIAHPLVRGGMLQTYRIMRIQTKL